MTLVLDLSDELEIRLRTVARAKGADEVEIARELLDRALPPINAPTGLSFDTARKVVLEPAKKRATGRGRFAHLLTDSETFAREKQEEIRKEEAHW